jgi:hypothetical protein
MKRLDEKLALLRLSEGLGLEPNPKLLEDIRYLQEQQQRDLKRQAELEARTRAASQALFESKPLIITRLTNPESNPEVVASVPVLEGEETQAQRLIDEYKPSNVDLVAKNLTETVVSQGEPGLVPQPADPLTKKVELLEKWISRIAATGPGGGEVNFRWLDDVDRSSINEDWYLTYNPTTKKFEFRNIYASLFDATRVSIEAFDRSTSIALTATPALLKPSSTTNVKNMTYDSSTGIFTFLTNCEVTLALILNAVSTQAGQRVYQYAERNTGSGWSVIANSGKTYELTNNNHTQIVNAQTVSRQAGEQIRYYIYSDDTKVSLVTDTMPNLTSTAVYAPAIRIQYAGR